jgi:hypothetical protein
VTANTPPTFVTLPDDQSTPAGIPKTYALPACTDAEGDTCTITMDVGGPTFVTFTPPDTLNIGPTLNDVG